MCIRDSTRTILLAGHSITVFGFGWGVPGAALGTALSNVVGGLLALACLLYTSASMYSIAVTTICCRMDGMLKVSTIWAVCCSGTCSVSYTHLDVYKRQDLYMAYRTFSLFCQAEQ